MSSAILKQFKELFTEDDIRQYKTTTSDAILKLPDEYIPLWKPDNSYVHKHAISYLKHRGITADEILRYRIGYCTRGSYANRIILPSFDRNNNLNYFTGRLFYDGGMKYKNPPTSKNVICFENMIDFSEPIVLVEGMFDAITLRRNAIPLMGKVISTSLEKALLEHKVSTVIIFLDEDARLDAMKLEQRLNNHGINASLVLTTNKDANQMGFREAWEQIKTARTTDFKQFIEHKLNLI